MIGMRARKLAVLFTRNVKVEAFLATVRAARAFATGARLFISRLRGAPPCNNNHPMSV
jgi:hypothetical protein